MTILLKQVCFAGIRMIKSNKAGTLAKFPQISLDEGILELVWTKKMGDYITD